jgi:hypothetical protein
MPSASEDMHGRLHALQAALHAFSRSSGLALEGCELERERGQSLAGVIVELAGEPPALFLLSFDQQCSQLV